MFSMLRQTCPTGFIIALTITFSSSVVYAQSNNTDRNGRTTGVAIRSATSMSSSTLDKDSKLSGDVLVNGSDLDGGATLQMSGAEEDARDRMSVLPGIGLRSFQVEEKAPENSLTISEEGRIGIGLNTPRGRFHVVSPDASRDLLLLDDNGNLSIGGLLSEASSQLLKQDFVPVDAVSILDKVEHLPLVTWSYRNDSPDTRHLGPMAQDFHALFGLGDDDTSIASLDVGGISLAAIQALAMQSRQQEARIQQLEERIQELEALVQESK